MKNKQIKGYKVTDANLRCRMYQFELGKKFKETGTLSICNNGFHFCQILTSCFEYYSFDPTNRVFEVIANGSIITDGDKSCTLEIEFLRELSWLEVLVLVNTGKDNTGRNNSGDSNSGNWNSGNRNSGDSNSGNWNSGNRNSGDSNSGYRNSGAFCTDRNPRLVLFDVQTDILVKDWEQSDACRIMNNLNPNIWVYSEHMTEQEKKDFSTHGTTGGYLKSIPYKEAWTNLWGNLSDDKKKVFTSLPHFNKDKFKEITGISV